MNVSQIIKEIQKILRDQTILKQDILDGINRKQREISALTCLPDLVETDTVTVESGDTSVAMPTTFQHSLLECYSTTHNCNIEIRTNSKSLYRDHVYGEDVGEIEECALDGRTLHVRPEATADEDLQIRFYRYPVDLSENIDDPPTTPDDPDGFPEEFHRSLFVSGVVANLLPLTDMDPATAQRLVVEHATKYAEGRAEIARFFPYAAKATPKPRRKILEF